MANRIINLAPSGSKFYGWGVVPIGGTVSFPKNLTGVPTMPSGYVECNGQTLSDAASTLNGTVIPDINGSLSGQPRFIRGGTSSGGTGGADTHTHTLSTTSTSLSAGGNTVTTSSTTGSSSTLPAYYTMVIIMRVK